MSAARTFYVVVSIIAGILDVSVVLAAVRLPRLIGDHMVLQRDCKITVWGWADPGETVQINLHGQHKTTRADRLGQWSASLDPFGAGGPYDITVSGKNTIKVHDVLIGDVWVASGQSNMEFPVKANGSWMTGVDNADRELSGAGFPQIRLLLVERNAAPRLIDDVTTAGWRAVTSDNVAAFSAVAYLFGRELHQRYHVPIGMIQSSWAGSVAEAWMSAESLKNFPEFNEAMETVRLANDKTAAADFDRYKKEKTAWYSNHAAEDRGLSIGRAIWADPAFDSSVWPTIVQPQIKSEDALKGFDGAVWFRREIIIPKGMQVGRARVHLTEVCQTDTTYFNGEKIGETSGWDKPRDYAVPAQLVRPGRNVIALRITGSSGCVGIFDLKHLDSRMNFEIGASAIPLAGVWSYQPGPDLSDLPAPPPLAKLNAPPMTTVLFNGMIYPLIQFRIRGVIWYQGEANAIDYRSTIQYRNLFRTLIEDWRRHWGREVPFLFVQLAGYGHNEPEPADYRWAELREAQGMALSLPGTGMATAVDIGDEDNVHPRNKQEVARRLALVAAKVVYGENVVYSGPTYQSAQNEESRIRVKFSNLGSGLVIKDQYGYIRGFEIAAADGKYYWAQARQDGNDVLVFNNSLQHPISVRYNWRNTPDGNLFNAEGLPASPFRTDAPREPGTRRKGEATAAHILRGQ